MQGRFTVWMLFAALSFVPAGCSCGSRAAVGADGVSNSVNDDLSKAADIAQKSNGDYSKLTPEQKNLILKLANNDPKQAADMLRKMVHPPGEKYSKKN